MQDGRQLPAWKLLIVDDERSNLTLLSDVLIDAGFLVRSVEDGFSALGEIRKEIPDILVSDLNMPGMSGFELLSVVNSCFPSIRVIAMSGAFMGDEVPVGVVADAFYQKGCGIGSLLGIIAGLAQLERLAAKPPFISAPYGSDDA